MKLTYTLAFVLCSISVARATFQCAICPATIVHDGITTDFVLAIEDEENVVQCSFSLRLKLMKLFESYDDSDNDVPICAYFNFDGVFLIGTIGTNCPNTVPLAVFAGTGTCIAADSKKRYLCSNPQRQDERKGRQMLVYGTLKSSARQRGFLLPNAENARHMAKQYST
ncbi:hypothetical protein F5890DRAFT_1475492 [Lentinula detonsa]|uniref:Uncharacterized protein n=1 Tax=Lentinula detonsa TaxID=2804962 RepID=A0AA38UT59_9AGAR|nr:hypothetical protein F5890DRAFT_1475492 [Lentinula detonsa]